MALNRRTIHTLVQQLNLDVCSLSVVTHPFFDDNNSAGVFDMRKTILGGFGEFHSINGRGSEETESHVEVKLNLRASKGGYMSLTSSFFVEGYTTYDNPPSLSLDPRGQDLVQLLPWNCSSQVMTPTALCIIRMALFRILQCLCFLIR